MNLNARQKSGISLMVGGVVSLGVGIATTALPVTPGWIQIFLNILGFILPALGLAVNLPADTNK